MRKESNIRGGTPMRTKAVPTDPMADITMPKGYGVRDRGEGKGIQFRLNSPAVVDHCARVVLKHNMDFEAAVATMSPKKLTDEQIASQAILLRRSPKVQAALSMLFREIGIDDDAFKKYYGLLWEWAEKGDRPRAVTAVKLLGAIFGINDKSDESKKPQTLQISGIEEGLRKMGVVPSSVNPTGFGKIEEESEEDE